MLCIQGGVKLTPYPSGAHSLRRKGNTDTKKSVSKYTMGTTQAAEQEKIKTEKLARVQGRTGMSTFRNREKPTTT